MTRTSIHVAEGSTRACTTRPAVPAVIDHAASRGSIEPPGWNRAARMATTQANCGIRPRPVRRRIWSTP
ncbi:hypothetical protein [Paludisphaera mucosa]|uniref:Uncharacterized protein n=1 Tax=Paludisphaera mucosa TaxID=3030827 RepID=A0ABT6FCV9_9BACT|nr:hypothetical protein [Paludisphaera mucosa]MDG3005372.1 hypothetical protein [Paludisphaera mucosa]